MDQELAQLRRSLAEAEAGREEEQRLREEEQRLREEEQRLREEEQRLREEEQRLREAAEARATDAERLAESALPTTLAEYIQACHKLSLAIKVITDRTLTTQGDTTKPAGRLFPRRIIPWPDFGSQQESIWEKLSKSRSFHARKAFPSTHQLDYVRKRMNPISGELGLRNFTRETVENAVQILIEEVYKDEQLRERLNLRGTITFESHTNLGQSKSESVDEAMEQMSISEPSASTEDNGTTKDRRRSRGRSAGNESQERTRTPSSKPARRVMGKGSRADQFCIYRLSDGQSIPVVAIEYKAPHKLPHEDIVTGLSGEIDPAQDVINKEEDSFTFLSKSLMAAVITQCFSYMIGKGIQHGYLCTGEVFVFLHIPDNPTMVYYHFCIPNLDVKEDDENIPYQSAVAQTFAFVLQALAVEPPSQSWHDMAADLDVWAVEYIDILKKIPETVRKECSHSAYKPTRWKSFVRSPIQTRFGCRSTDSTGPVRNDKDDEDDDGPPTPTPKQPAYSQGGQNTFKSTKGRRAGNSSTKRPAGDQDEDSAPRLRIEDRPYCTHRCLLGLVHGGSLDMQCPNIQDHKTKHMKRETFLRLICVQLAKDRGSDADCKPLYVHGARGALFKLRLSSHGYTLVAKGMEESKLDHLHHENRVYDHISSLQGTFVPVCLGAADLELPYYYNGGVYVRMLFLSWAGQPLFDHINQSNEELLLGKATRALRALHKLQILHKDAEPRNILYDKQQDCLMLVDFERAELQIRRPLGPASLNLKRKRDEVKRAAPVDDCFVREVRAAKSCISRYIR